MQALWMLAASLCFAVMGAMIKLASEHSASLGEIVLARGLVPVVLIGSWALLKGLPLHSPVARLHIRRSGFGLVAMVLGFYSTTHLPLSTSTTLMYTSPLFLALILRFYYKQVNSRLENLCIVLGFLGVLCILQPVFGRAEMLIALIGLCGGGVSALAYLQLKSLGQVNEPEWRTVFYFGLTASLMSLSYIAVAGHFTVADSRQPMLGLVYLLGVGFFGGSGNLAVTRSFGSGSTWLSASLQYTTILFAAGLGVTVFGDTPKAGTWLGIVLIVACGGLSTWATRMKNKASA